MEVEPVESDKNLRGLRRLDDEVESHIRSLSALGVVSDSYGAMLAPVLLKKLPPDVRLTISRKTASSNPNVDQVLKIMGEELIARERSSHHAATPRHHEKHSAALFASSSHSHTPNCCYCHQAHSSIDCDTIKSVDARKQALRSSGRCFNCLGRGHLSRTCRSSTRCSNCRGKHHTSVCACREPPRSLIQPPKTTSPLNPSASPFTSTSNNLCASSIKTSCCKQLVQGYTTFPSRSTHLRFVCC